MLSFRPEELVFCSICSNTKLAKRNDGTRGIDCHGCRGWVHLDCEHFVSPEEYDELQPNERLSYLCPTCAVTEKEDPAPVGLQNTGNKCWLISIIQVCAAVDIYFPS